MSVEEFFKSLELVKLWLSVNMTGFYFGRPTATPNSPENGTVIDDPFGQTHKTGTDHDGVLWFPADDNIWVTIRYQHQSVAQKHPTGVAP